MTKIIAIEGFWRVGKTTLCKIISKKIKKAKYIQEPDHLKVKKRPKNVEYWYLKKWKEKMELAKKYKEKGYVVIMERSVISTVAFNNALHKKTTEPMKKLIEYHKQNIPDSIIILKVPKSFVKKLINNKIDKKILKTRALYIQKDFLDKYITYFYKSIINFRIPCFSVNVANNHDFYPLQNIIKIVLKKIINKKSPIKINRASLV